MLQQIDHTTANGAELGYQVRGGEGGPPLIFAHGYALRGTGGLYAGLLDRLAETYTVFALDLRGQGASADVIHPWSFETVADDLTAFLQRLKLDRPVFVGHSFGAVVGLLAEMRHPGAFAAMGLLSPGPADHRRDPVETLDSLIEHGHDREAMRESFSAMFMHGGGSALEQVLDAVVMVSPDVHRAQKAENPSFSIDDRLGEVSAPTVLVCGKADNVVPLDRQLDMARKLPRSKLVLFSKEGHMLAIERPGIVADEVTTFLPGAKAQS